MSYEEIKSKLFGIEVINDPNLPEGHICVKNGNELLIGYPTFHETCKFLNKLAPGHFNKTNIKSYEFESLGTIDFLMPRYLPPEPPMSHEPSTDKDRILTRLAEIFWEEGD